MPAKRRYRSAVILAGGRSSRFGTDKALFAFRKKPLIYWTAKALSGIADELLISVAARETREDINYYNRYLDAVECPATLAFDEFVDFGPISGIIASFKQARGEYVAIAPCDSPFIVPELYEFLFEIADGKDGAVPKCGQHYEPLHAVYKRGAMIAAAEKVVAAGGMKPIDAYNYLELSEVGEARIRGIDAHLKTFVNINTIHEYEKIKNEKTKK